jgi:hypothetical protein
MKKLLWIVGIGTLGYALFLLLPKLAAELPEGRLRRVVEVPGSAVSRMEIAGMDPNLLLVGAVVLLVVLVGLYAIISR